MRLKLFKKLVFTNALIIIISLTLIVMILGFAISNYFSKENYDKLNNSCTAVARVAIMDYSSSNFQRNLYNIISVQGRVSEVDCFITDTNGQILLCGCTDSYNDNCTHTDKVIPRSILNSADVDKYFEIGRLNKIYGSDYYTVGVAYYSTDGVKLGYVFSSASAIQVQSLMKEIFELYIISAIIPLIIMFIVIYAITYRFTKPLKLMSSAAKSMAKGDFSKRIPVVSNDEIGELSVSFNHMTNSLARLENMRRSFVGNVSHELRTPMTTISGFIDGIIDGTIPEEKQSRYLSIISDEVKRLSRVVESMLNLSRLESGETSIKPMLFDISEVIVNIVIGREKNINEKNIEIVGLDSLEKCFIYADYDLIYQVVYNLFDNALKFTDNSGQITFEVNNYQKNVDFSIANTGHGIEKDSIDSIFDRFYKVDKARSVNKNSAGLGLYIVKTIVNIHGGKIKVQSIPDKETIFTVSLPNKNIKGE